MVTSRYKRGDAQCPNGEGANCSGHPGQLMSAIVTGVPPVTSTSTSTCDDDKQPAPRFAMGGEQSQVNSTASDSIPIDTIPSTARTLNVQHPLWRSETTRGQ